MPLRYRAIMLAFRCSLLMPLFAIVCYDDIMPPPSLFAAPAPLSLFSIFAISLRRPYAAAIAPIRHYYFRHAYATMPLRYCDISLMMLPLFR